LTRPGAGLLVAFVGWSVVVFGVHLHARGADRDGAPQGVAPRLSRTQAPVAPAPPQGPATNIGDTECLGCHDQFEKGYAGTPHHRAMDPRTPAARQGCETCHGPASLHAEDPFEHSMRDLTTAPADEVNATCATCHRRGEHALWDGSQHESRGLSCMSCHNIHAPKSAEHALGAASESALCASCHRDKTSRIDRSGHMPVREGKMECSTCHSPHGATNVKLLAKGDSVAELCTSCHADKRGPYLWEHAPGRDGCVTCHDPHGSSNERMLVAKPPILCQRCHVGTRHPSTIYDSALVGAGSTPSARVYARSCVTCHANIHGSNHPSGQFFIR
jgi:DmsE family decaheme c-type cytochrome